MNGSLLPRVLLACTLLIAAPVVADELCFVPSPTNQWNVTIDCDQNPWDNDWIGYSTSGVPCQDVSSIKFCLDEYSWMISRESNDPLANGGPIPPDSTLYLWACTELGGGISAAEFAISGSLEIVSVNMVGGFANFGTLPEFLIVSPTCEKGFYVAAELAVSSSGTVGSPERWRDSPWGQIKALYR